MAWLIVIGQLSIPISAVSIFLISRKANFLVDSCMGRLELFYPFDYFFENGEPKDHYTDNCLDSPYYLTSVCQLLQILMYIIGSNICDIIIIIIIAMRMKSQTISASDILSPNVLRERKR